MRDVLGALEQQRQASKLPLGAGDLRSLAKEELETAPPSITSSEAEANDDPLHYFFDVEKEAVDPQVQELRTALEFLSFELTLDQESSAVAPTSIAGSELS